MSARLTIAANSPWKHVDDIAEPGPLMKAPIHARAGVNDVSEGFSDADPLNGKTATRNKMSRACPTSPEANKKSS